MSNDDYGMTLQVNKRLKLNQTWLNEVFPNGANQTSFFVIVRALRKEKVLGISETSTTYVITNLSTLNNGLAIG